MIGDILLAYVCIGIGINLAPSVLHLGNVRGLRDHLIAAVVIVWLIIIWPVHLKGLLD